MANDLALDLGADDALSPWPADAVERWPIARLIPNARNARTHTDAQVAQIAGSIREWGWTMPVLVDEAGTLIAGHGRVLAGLLLGLDAVPTMVARGWSDAKKRAYMLADNKLALNAGWNEPLLRLELGELLEAGLSADLLGFDDGELRTLLGDLDTPTGSGALADRFGAVPFSVLNAREGWWQARKRGWLALGIQSEVGRPGVEFLHAQDKLEGLMQRGRAKAKGAAFTGEAVELEMTPISIFDPVLCELAYRWFCPPGGQVLDPFAGGSVRGVVAAKLGRPYYGTELRTEQVEANGVQWAAMAAAVALDAPDAPAPTWVQGDSLVALDGPDTPDADFVFSCPPYADLEHYSDDPADLSAMDYPAFLAAYRAIIAKACAHLREDRFAAWVVSKVRSPEGGYRGFVSDTVAAFADAGLVYYDKAILVTMVGSLPLRVGQQFSATRKLGRTHQNVLVFLKGNARRAVAACGEVEVGDLAGQLGEDVENEPRPGVPTVPPVPTVPQAAAPAPRPVQGDDLTPVDDCGGWWAKREDFAGYDGPDYPAGAKVRQFKMAADQPAGTPMVIGCSAESAMQIYIAAAARQLGVEAHVFVPGRKVRSAATAYAANMGAHVTEVRPGYLSVCKSQAREKSKELGAVVKWNPKGATLDTMAQCENLPADVRRVVVPLGTGAICAGVLAGLALRDRAAVEVLAVAVSDLADPDTIKANAAKFAGDKTLPPLTVVKVASGYDTPARAALPSGKALDPFYAAKALPYVQPGDCLWVSGVRPAMARP